jgi:hypothetical protein
MAIVQPFTPITSVPKRRGIEHVGVESFSPVPPLEPERLRFRATADNLIFPASIAVRFAAQ